MITPPLDQYPEPHLTQPWPRNEGNERSDHLWARALGIATAALMAALFASGGAAALAVAGYATSAISVVQSCR